MIVLDTNVISELVRPVPDPKVVAWFNSQLPSSIFTTSITVAEVNFGVTAAPPGARTNQLALAYNAVFSALLNKPIPFDDAAAAAYGPLAAAARKAAKGFPSPDGLIAAIAVSRGFIVATRDTAPFLACGMNVIDPWV